MAAPSPSVSNNSSDTATTTTTTTTIGSAVTANVTVSSNHLGNRTGTPPKTLRGLNKPKCRVCGNVARSRCPYESCKSCCARNQNPCHIHVLKANATFSDKTPTSSSPLFDKQSTDPSSSSGTLLRVASLRQLSSNFSQFNNVQIPLRSRKPLTRKDAAAINEWRFSKLREFRERHIEAENEAFDRYMQNVNLLEEVFSMKSMIDGSIKDGASTNSATESNPEEMVPGFELMLGSNLHTSANSRKRIRKIVEDGLRKLQKVEGTNNINEVTDQAKPVKVADQTNLDDGHKTEKARPAKKVQALGDLIDKLNKARNEEDLTTCLAMKHELFSQQITSGQKESEETDTSKEQVIKKDLDARKECGYSLPKLISKTNIDIETLNQIDAHFSSLKQIGHL